MIHNEPVAPEFDHDPPPDLWVIVVMIVAVVLAVAVMIQDPALMP